MCINYFTKESTCVRHGISVYDARPVSTRIPIGNARVFSDNLAISVRLNIIRKILFEYSYAHVNYIVLFISTVNSLQMQHWSCAQTILVGILFYCELNDKD